MIRKGTGKMDKEKRKGFRNEFREFIMRGNVMDMAVGIIIGGAFTAIVTSLNTDIISPLLSIFGGVDLSALKVTIGSGADAPVIGYGKFIMAVINFIIIAFVVFMLVKSVNKMNDLAQNIPSRQAEEEAPAAPTTKICPYCKSEISIDATRCPHCTSQLDDKE